MEQELKSKWVAALRSGEYKQGRRELKDSRGRYCCLGVLCLIAGQSIGREHTENYNFTEKIIGTKIQSKCISMNDEESNTFLEIADYIEANL